ncbi:hypothetical protein [Mesorhizobium sp. 131-2-1]|uniref:hypothetical protein n=1 Tax=Mesorhizobium sp. 131-2-1 TaxID=2744518 RepID=UPI001927ED25|nr:hypothetical protein [Mesorhizobium sp. 131-2-1]
MHAVWIGERLLKQRQFNMPRDHGCDYERAGAISNPPRPFHTGIPMTVFQRASARLRSRAHQGTGQCGVTVAGYARVIAFAASVAVVLAGGVFI